MTGNINSAGSTYAAYVDDAIEYCSTKAKDFKSYVKSESGKSRINAVEKVAKFAIALLFALSSPTIVIFSAIVGTALRIMAPKQLTSLEETISTIWKKLPFHVTALGLAATMLYAFPLLPAYAGMAAGLELGSLIPGLGIANKQEKAI